LHGTAYVPDATSWAAALGTSRTACPQEAVGMSTASESASPKARATAALERIRGKLGHGGRPRPSSEPKMCSAGEMSADFASTTAPSGELPVLASHSPVPSLRRGATPGLPHPASLRSGLPGACPLDGRRQDPSHNRHPPQGAPVGLPWLPSGIRAFEIRGSDGRWRPPSFGGRLAPAPGAEALRSHRSPTRCDSHIGTGTFPSSARLAIDSCRGDA
jgi:hypothetical protein